MITIFKIFEQKNSKCRFDFSILDKVDFETFYQLFFNYIYEKTNFYQCIKDYIDFGLDINYISKTTAILPLLRYAAAYTDGSLRLLLNNGADPNIQGVDSFTPLMIACHNEIIENVILLLDAGADPLIKNNQQKTAYDYLFYNFKDELKKYPDIYNKLKKGKEVKRFNI